eukprot:SAG22_NODE_231_length_14551_cov_22.298090_13_plen_157_part_00
MDPVRRTLVIALKTGQWLHLALGKSAPNLHDFDSAKFSPTTAAFPVYQLFTAGFGRDETFQRTFLKPDDMDPDHEGILCLWCSRGDWADKGHGLVITTSLDPAAYRAQLLAAWPEFPFDKLVQYVVRPTAPGKGGKGGSFSAQASAVVNVAKWRKQ